MTGISWQAARFAIATGLAALLFAPVSASAEAPIQISPVAPMGGSSASSPSTSSYPPASNTGSYPSSSSGAYKSPPSTNSYPPSGDTGAYPPSSSTAPAPNTYSASPNYSAAPPPPAADYQSSTTTKSTYSESEVVKEGEQFFGSASKGMADAVHSVFARYGEPNAFIRGEEGTGAFIVGLRYGSGELVMKQGGATKVYWAGPSIGWDFGGNAVKSFTLIYNLPAPDAIFQRFPGVEGSAYLIGGISINYQQRGNIVLAPMRAGVGLRLGASVGYLNYTPNRDWLPF